MTITEEPPDTDSDTGPAAMIRSLLVGAVFGAIIAGVVVGIVVRNAALGGGAGGVFVLLVVVLTLSSRWDRRRRPKPPPAEKALAMIESRRATDGESADVPIRFDLTVAPDGQPAYRVQFTQAVNLVDIPAYQERRVVVVEYPADKPWSVRIVTRPDPEWERRAAVASIDSAPPSTLVKDTSRTGTYCLLGFLGILLGAAVIVVLFRGDLFKDDDGSAARRPPSAGAPANRTPVSTSSTVATTSGSLLENGLMRTTANSMIKAAGTSSVITFRIEEHRMSADGVPAGQKPGKPPIDLRAVPYEQLPGLVRDATTGLGLHDPGSWHIDIGDGGRTGGMLIRVTVSDGRDSASLEADAQGRVTARHPH